VDNLWTFAAEDGIPLTVFLRQTMQDTYKAQMLLTLLHA